MNQELIHCAVVGSRIQVPDKKYKKDWGWVIISLFSRSSFAICEAEHLTESPNQSLGMRKALHRLPSCLIKK